MAEVAKFRQIWSSWYHLNPISTIAADSVWADFILVQRGSCLHVNLVNGTAKYGPIEFFSLPLILPKELRNRPAS